MYMAMEVEKLKLKYITLKEKLQIKTQEANQAENEYNEVAQKLQKVWLYNDSYPIVMKKVLHIVIGLNSLYLI